MMLIRNKLLPFKGFTAINIFGILFYKDKNSLNSCLLNHEKIHTKQMVELLFIGFYLWYVLEWIVRIFMRGNAYQNISFEREAYNNQRDLQYLENRKHYSWIKYLRKNINHV